MKNSHKVSEKEQSDKHFCYNKFYFANWKNAENLICLPVIWNSIRDWINNSEPKSFEYSELLRIFVPKFHNWNQSSEDLGIEPTKFIIYSWHKQVHSIHCSWVLDNFFSNKNTKLDNCG